MTRRYAIYLAPPPESALFQFGSRVLGRDAATGADIFGFAPSGYSPEAWREATAEPRRYGFHATLKAPFRLREGENAAALEARIGDLAGSLAAFDLGPLALSTLCFGGGGFVALTPVRAPPELGELERRVVRELDGFRAAPTDAEIARRHPERLTPQQREYLRAWGYPYVLDEFRLHFTLSGAMEAPEMLAQDLAGDFAPPNLRVDALTLFVQEEHGDFRILRRFAMARRHDEHGSEFRL